MVSALANALARPDVRTALLRAPNIAGAEILANVLAREGYRLVAVRDPDDVGEDDPEDEP